MENKKYPIVWEYKGHSYSIGDTGDYDGYWEITNGKDSLITKEDYDDIEKDLQAIVDLLNSTYANFTVDRGAEAALDAENKWLQSELSTLMAQQGGWVKASEFKHEVGVAYHAKDSKSKGAGSFDVFGFFYWGDGSFTHPNDQGELLILDESPNAYQELKFDKELVKRHAIMFAKWVSSIQVTEEDYKSFMMDNQPAKGAQERN
jgi:hypothetical protein